MQNLRESLSLSTISESVKLSSKWPVKTLTNGSSLLAGIRPKSYDFDRIFVLHVKLRNLST